MARFAPIALALVLGASAPAQQAPHQMVTQCWEDVLRLDMGDDPIQVPVPGVEGITVRLDPAQGRFSVRRGARTLFTFVIEDLSSNAQVLWSPDGHAFALNYSDGGAIGGFHVRVFLMQGDTVTEALNAIRPAVGDFKARHYCKSRGNNVRALKWAGDSRHLVLMTEVYPSGDCGPDLGHAEAYVVAVPDGKVEHHLTLNQLKIFPGICLENDEAR